MSLEIYLRRRKVRRSRKCNVRLCGLSSRRMFTFPNPIEERERFQEWITASGNPHLLQVPKHKIVRMSVCSIHFEKKYFLSKRLSKTAIPTLHLPEPIDGREYNFDTPTGIDLPKQPEDVKKEINLSEPLHGLLSEPDIRAEREFRTFLELQHTNKILGDSPCKRIYSDTHSVGISSTDQSFGAVVDIKREKLSDDDDDDCIPY